MTIVELLSQLRDRDITIWKEDGDLRYNAPKGALTPDLRAQLVAYKAQILAFLSEAAASTAEPLLHAVAYGGPLPLSFAQQRLWFLDQLTPGSALYNIPLAIRLTGSLDRAALEQSLSAIVRRHDVIRMRFWVQDGQPVQAPLPAWSITLAPIDLQVLPETEREATALRLANEEGVQPFDLAHGHLMRAKLIRLAAEEHILLLTLHHIVADGWSLGVLIRELAALYEAYSTGSDIPLPELPLQYADYVLWQREWLSSSVSKAQRDYWMQQLAADFPTLELPLDHPRPAAPSYAGKSLTLTLPRALSAAIRAVSAQEDATLFMVLLAAFKIVLSRYVEHDDLAIGAPVAGRTRVELEGLIGCFLNTIVLRTDLSGNPTVRDVLQRVRTTTIGSYAHQDLPFEQVMAELQPRRDLQRAPLFRVFFNMLNFPLDQISLRGLTWNVLLPPDIGAKFDLTLYVREQGEEIGFELVYNASLFEPATMRALLEQLQHVLAQIAEHPDAPIAAFSLVTPDAQAYLPNPTAALEVAWTGSVQSAITEQARSTPTAEAVIDAETVWTYAELDECGNRIANYLIAHGIQPQDLVAIYAHRSAALVGAVLGVLKAGAAFMILDPAYPVARLLDSMRVAPPQAWIELTAADQPSDTITAFVATACRCRLELSADTLFEAESPLADYAAVDPQIAVEPDDLAYIAFTSGSTGQPKAIAGTHRPLAHFLRWHTQTFGLNASDRFSMLSGLAHDPLLRDLFTPLYLGATLCIPDPDQLYYPGWLAAWMEREAISVVHLTPAMGQVLAESTEPDTELQLRYAFFGGDVLTWRDTAALRRLAPQVSCVNFYGTTETPQAMGYYIISHQDTLPFNERSPEPGPMQQIPIGWGISDVQLLILTATRQLAGIGELGEIYVRTPYLTRGYLGNPDATHERFLPNPFTNAPGDRLYRTGDLGRYRSDGSVEFVGRADRQIKLRGFRIELDEISATLDQHPQVRDRAVIVREDQSSQKEIVAYVVAQRGSDIVDDLYGFLSARLPHYMLPSAIVPLEALPLTPNGKLDERALPMPDRDRLELDELFAEPSTPTETALADIWAQVFKVSKVGVHDNFFELGGHSLLATQILARVRDTFQADIPLRRMFDAPTIAGFAAIIDSARGMAMESSLRPLRPIGREAPLPASFAQQRMWLLNQLDPLSPAYNIPTVLRLTGPLNLAALELALNEIVRRHEILRTTFAMVEGDLVQIIAPPQQMTLTKIQLHADSPAAREEQIKDVTIAEVQQPFDLVRGPLLRVALLQLADDEHVLLLTMHHIVADGWSTEVFIRELATLYEAVDQQRPAPLPDLAIQYADFAHWQREALQGSVLQEHLDYWRQQLSGAPPTLDLPTDRPRPAMQTFHGARYPFLLAYPLAEAIRALSQREGVTPFMTLLSAFQILLARYTGERDIVVGTPIAGRTQYETENLIGFFVNTLVLRTDLAGNPSFREVLRRVREVTTNAYLHQDLPFEKLVEALQPTRDLSRTPLFQVMFILQNVPLPTQRLPDLTLELIGVDSKTAQFDLTLVLTEVADGIRGRFEYNTDLFDAATIGRIADHFQILLEQLVAQPDRRIMALPLLTATEQQLLAEWNATAIRYPRDACIHHLFEAQAARTPEAIAVVFQDQHLTYSELNRRANRLARHLSAIGVTRGTLVGISMLRSLDLPMAILGVLKAGGCYLPLDPTYPQARLGLMIEDSQVPVLITQSRLMGQLPQHGATVVCLDGDWPTISQEPDTNPDVAVSADDLAYVIYTSGSTGKPKGVMIQHRNVVNFFTGMDERIGSDSGGTWLSVTSISFDISVLELLWTLARGFRVVIQANWAHGSAPVAKPIDFSLFYFSSGEGQGGADKYRLLLEGAKFADRHGFTAVWTPERHFHSFGGLYPNPSVVSAALAVLTERIQIRAGSVVLPLQNPVRVAEEWAVVDSLSNGRVGLSFASGWHPDDFVLAPEKFKDRRAIMLRDIETVRGLWRGESVTLTSGAGNDVAISTLPRPIQPELPVWVTAAGSPETFRLAGEAGANLLTHLLGQSVEELTEKIAVYRQAWREHGYHGDGHVTLMLHTFIGEDLDLVREKVRRPFGDYLKDSISLWKNLARSIGYDIDSEQFTKDEEDALLAHAFDRYAETSALLGTPDTCLQMIDRLKAIGVDELACLIDFGVDVDSVLASLNLLNLVKERSNQIAIEDTADYTLPAQMIRHHVTHLQCTPSLAQMLLAEAETQTALGSLRQLLLGGEELSSALVEQLSTFVAPRTIYNMYGPTETTIWSTVHQVGDGERSVPIGRPIANTTIYILDPALNPVPIGVVGELYIGGDGVAPGYLRRPALSAERFIPNPFSSTPGARLYRTGDLARYRADGTVDFLGRGDQQVKISGYRIELGEIETVLRQHPLVHEAVTIVREDDPDKRYLAAYVVPEQPPAAGLKPVLAPPELEQILTGRHQYTLPNGMVITHLSDLQAAGIYREIFEDDMYLRHGITMKDAACIFDVGANIGLFTLFASQKARGARIFAFEPIPPTFDVLKTNVTLYGLEAQVFPFGLSDKIEDAEFTFYPQMSGLSGRYAKAAHDREATKTMILSGLQDQTVQAGIAELDEPALDDWLARQFKSERYTCHMRTLSDVIRQHGVEKIDLLKIDVEKAEFDVLCGIAESDWNKIDQIVIEVDTRENLSRIVDLLEAKGYHVIVEDLVIVEARDESASSYVYMLYAARQPLERQAPLAVGSRASARSNGASHEEIVGTLRSYLKDRLPDYMVPSVVMVLNALPLTPNGKVDRKALPAPKGFRAGSEAAYVAPRTEVEQRIAAIWQSAIHVEKVGMHDNFFELGGTSLLITQVRSRLRNELGYDVSLVDLFKYPTVRTLADYLSRSAPKKPSLDKVRERAERQMAKRQRRSSKG